MGIKHDILSNVLKYYLQKIPKCPQISTPLKYAPKPHPKFKQSA